MSLEIEMRNEITRLEEEMKQIDAEMQKLQTKIVNLINIRKKKEHDLAALKYNFTETQEDKEIQTSLERLLRL